MGRQTGVGFGTRVERGFTDLSIDVRGLRPGVYLCRAVLAGGSGTERDASRLVTILP